MTNERHETRPIVQKGEQVIGNIFAGGLADDKNTVTYLLYFEDGSKAKLVEVAGWVVWDPDPESELWRSGRYFTDSMAADWCATWRERFPGLVSIGLCSR